MAAFRGHDDEDDSPKRLELVIEKIIFRLYLQGDEFVSPDT